MLIFKLVANSFKQIDPQNSEPETFLFDDKWSNLVKIFEYFIQSDEEMLCVVFNDSLIKKFDFETFKPNKFFNVFDISQTTKFAILKFWFIKFILRIIIAQIYQISPLKNFMSRRLKRIATRQLALIQISKIIGISCKIIPNVITQNYAGFIFDRKAASVLSKFNQNDLISIQNVFQSVLRSSNLSFGSFLP